MDATHDDDNRAPARVVSPLDTALGEDSFRRVVEWAPSAMVLVDAHGCIVLVNAQTESMFQYPRAALIGQTIEILVPERYRNGHQSYRNGYMSDPRPRPMGAGRDLAGRRADGSEFPVEIGLNPIDTPSGPMSLASIVDISERLRTQQRLQDALRDKTTLLNEVHHRVKNNLQVITSLLNLQAAHAADPQLREILAESCGRVRAMSLTQQLLYEHHDYSRVDLAEYLRRLVQAICTSYRDAGNRVALRLQLPDAPLHIDLERSIPCGLLVNELLTNAFKHAFPGERQGSITLSLHADEGAWICLGVADDGVGLPSEQDLQQRATLGLQLVPLFVDQLHGVLHTTRQPGARFDVRFEASASVQTPLVSGTVEDT